MSELDSKAQDSLPRMLKFSVNGANDRVEKIENANIFAAKMGHKVVGVAFSAGSISLTSVKSSPNIVRVQESQDDELNPQKELVDIALARHLEGVALETMGDSSLQFSPKASPKIDVGSKHQEGQQVSNPRSENSTELQTNQSPVQQISDLVMVVCFRCTPEVGQPAFPFSGAVFPLYFGCTVIGRGKLQCLQLGSDKLIEIPHNSVSKRHAKIGDGVVAFKRSSLFEVIQFADILSNGTISITDMQSTNGTCFGSSIESIMQSSTSLQENTAVSILGGDYVSFGVCVCRIIPERAQTSRPQTLEIGEFEPSPFALDQLRILKITMNLHRMVDEEGFSPIEMARVISVRVGGDFNLVGTHEILAAENALSSKPAVQMMPPSILKRQHSSASAVKFDIQNISDDEAEANEDPFQNHTTGAHADVNAMNSNTRSNRPSTSNFYEVRSALNSERESLLDSVEGSMNFDTHTNDEIMRKMVLRLSQITKDLAEIQSVVLGRQSFENQRESRSSKFEDGGAFSQKAGFVQSFSMQPLFSPESSPVQLSRSESFNGQPKLGRQSSQRNMESGSNSCSNSTLKCNEHKDSVNAQGLDGEEFGAAEDNVSQSSAAQATIAESKKHISMKRASVVVATEVGTIRGVERLVQERKKDLRNRQLGIGIDRSSELNSKLYSFGLNKSGNKIRLFAPALIHILSFIDPIPGIFMLAGVNRELRTFCKNDELFFNLNLGHEKLRGTHVHERVTDKIIADMVMHRFRQVKIVNLQGCPFVTDQSLKAFIGHCQNLEELNLGRLMDIGPQITDAGMQLLIPHCVTLRTLDLSWLDGLTDTTILNVADSCTKLESLDVPNLYQLTNACIARLGSSPCHSTLTNLNMYGCGYIGDAAAFVIAQKFFNMMTLNLAGCDRIGPEAMVEIVSKLKLRSLNITGLYRLNDKCLFDMGPHVADLIRLRMGYLRCTDDGVGSIAKGLKNVTQFDMRGISDITDLAVVVMCQNMNNLRVVDMRGCRNVSVTARLMLAAKLEKNAILGELRMTTAIYADGC